MSLKDTNPVNAKKPKRVAIVVSNPAISPTTGWPVGFWWSELSHPYFAFTEKGYEVEIFSPNGGKCEPDAMSDPRDPSGYSSSDLISMGFIATPKLAGLIENTKPVSEIDVAAFDAILVAGGQAPMATFETAPRAASQIRGILRGGQGCLRALPRRRHPALRKALQWRVSRNRQNGHRLRQCRGGLRRQRRLVAWACFRVTNM